MADERDQVAMPPRLGARAPIVVPQELNQRWSLDFVSDQLANGRWFRQLNVIDDFNS